MSVDREKAVGASMGEREGSWEVDDVILYHLGIGAGVPATDPGEPPLGAWLAFTRTGVLPIRLPQPVTVVDTGGGDPGL